MPIPTPRNNLALRNRSFKQCLILSSYNRSVHSREGFPLGSRNSSRRKVGTLMDRRSQLRNRPTEVSTLHNKEASPTATRSAYRSNSRRHNRSSHSNRRNNSLVIMLTTPMEINRNIPHIKGQKEVDQAAAQGQSGSINLLLVEAALQARHPLSLLRHHPRTQKRYQRRPIF